MPPYRFVRAKDVLAIEVGGLAVARVTGMGTMHPSLQTRDRSGAWRGDTFISDADARFHLREYAELALWLRRRLRRGQPASAGRDHHGGS